MPILNMLEDKRILITGAGGFLGGHLLNALDDKDVKITALDIAKPNLQLSTLHNKEAKWVQANVATDDLSEHFSGVDVVYHLAGRYLPGNTDDVLKELCHLNVEGTKNVLKASRNAGAKRFIHISSAAVCGREDGGLISENDVHPNESYGVSKLKSEEVVKEICGDKIDCVILRPTAFFGENHLGSLYEMAKVIQKRRFVLIGNGQNRMNFLYVKDLVDVLIRAAQEAKMSGKTYIVADEPVRLKDFIDLTKKDLGLSSSQFYIPRCIGLAIGFGFDIVSRFIRRPMPLSVKRVLNMTHDAAYWGAMLKEDTGICFKYGMINGWARTIEWYKTQNLL